MFFYPIAASAAGTSSTNVFVLGNKSTDKHKLTQVYDFFGHSITNVSLRLAILLSLCTCVLKRTKKKQVLHLCTQHVPDSLQSTLHAGSAPTGIMLAGHQRRAWGCLPEQHTKTPQPISQYMYKYTQNKALQMCTLCMTTSVTEHAAHTHERTQRYPSELSNVHFFAEGKRQGLEAETTRETLRNRYRSSRSIHQREPLIPCTN